MKSIFKNVSLSLLARIISMLGGLIVQRYILVAYGSTYNGLTSSISQILSYLVLLEAGLSAASIQALYKPLSKENWSEANGIIKATSICYNNVAKIFLLLLLVVSFLVPIVVSGEIDFIIAGLLTFLTGAAQVVVYFLGGKYIALLTADRKIYIRYLANIVATTLSVILRVISLKSGLNIVYVQAIHLVCVIIENVLIIMFVRKIYKKIDMRCKPRFDAIGKRWNVLIHNISGLIVNHTDIILLTVFDSLKTVSIYSVYNNIFAQISNIIQSVFLQAPQGNFGILYAKNKSQFDKIYSIYETLFTMFLFIIVSLGLILSLSFIEIYTRGISDAKNYTKIILPILFSLILLMNQIRVPVLISINCAGAYKETQKGAMFEAIINLCVSLVLYFTTSLGMYGMLIGTIISYIYRTTDVIIYSYKKLLNRKIVKFFRLALTNFVCMVAIFIFFYILFPIKATSYVVWILKSFVMCLVVGVVYLTFNLIFNYIETANALNFILLAIRKKIKRGENKNEFI